MVSKLLCIKCVLVPFGILFLYQLNWKDGISVGGNITQNRNTKDKPLFVVGILTCDSTADRRASQRNTWISTMVQYADKLPFRIIYKFVFDHPSNASIYENHIYNDIVYLNVTHHGWAVKFGEKLYKWLQYLHTNYPDALIAAKMDDDVFLCIPQITARLYELLSPTLYYGWRRSRSNSPEIDEMFVVLGMDLIKRIMKRKYCGESDCHSHTDLINHNFAHTALYNWLSIYNDVDLYADQKMKVVWRIKDREKVFARYINKDSCVDNVLLHKALPKEMYQLYELTSPVKFPQVEGSTNFIETKSSNKSTVFDFNGTLAGSVTGSLFSGNMIRSIPEVPLKEYWSITPNPKEKTCENWAVVTTIYPPSKAVQYIAKLRNWCLLVVADIKTPLKNRYLKNLSNQKTIKYLTIVEQKERYPMLAEAIPFNHFGRKNIGYIYAIQHKAKKIWDFDDDNIGIVDTMKFNSISTATDYAEVCTKYVTKIVNPYPYFGVNETYTWPRGFPLQLIKDNRTIPKECDLKEKKQVGIMQALANEQPDVDAIYRLTRNVPFNFSNNNKRALLIPRHSYTPFNAQATLWFSSSFDLMPLPVSVNGRVSDIWRSYIAQFFLHKKNIYLAFLPPCVFQERNPHNTLKDFNAEMDLYEKSNQLIEFLSSSDASNLNSIKEVYEQLYARNYIDISDLIFIQAWEKTLSTILEKLKL